MRTPLTFSALFALLASLVLLLACERRDAAPPVRVTPDESVEPPSPWRDHASSWLVAVPEDDEELAARLAAAIDEARATADSARERWEVTPGDQRGNWAVKWAAPTLDGDVEYVWLVPSTWSPFRIEGTLLSDPVAELECGRDAGEPVSFPIDELADWILFVTGDPDGPREGGFTRALLEQHYGMPGG